uniref:Uncharacterized protein n=1 Tax=Oryza brachyantha TaxID=4533 RepID=J3KVS7_ORYBR
MPCRGVLADAQNPAPKPPHSLIRARRPDTNKIFFTQNLTAIRFSPVQLRNQDARYNFDGVTGTCRGSSCRGGRRRAWWRRAGSPSPPPYPRPPRPSPLSPPSPACIPMITHTTPPFQKKIDKNRRRMAASGR